MRPAMGPARPSMEAASSRLALPWMYLGGKITRPSWEGVLTELLDLLSHLG